MQWHEVKPVPKVCVGCTEKDCYNCDYAGQRWRLSREDELKSRRKMMVKAIERLQRQVQAIDEEIAKLC